MAIFMPARKYNWGKVKDEYILSGPNGITLKDLSEKYQIPYLHVRRMASEQNWNKIRWALFNLDLILFIAGQKEITTIAYKWNLQSKTTLPV